MLVLACSLLALSPAPLLPARRSPLAPRRAAACRCAQSMKGFSPAYDTTVRYAAVDWARNLRTLPGTAAWSKCLRGSARAWCLRLAAPGSSGTPRARGRTTSRPATASGARARRLQRR